MKQLMKISSWVRLNGFRISLMFHYDSYRPNIPNFFKEGAGNFKPYQFTILISSTKGNLSTFHQLGKVREVASFLQVIKKNNSSKTLKFRNLSMLKQERKVKKISQARIFIDNIVISKVERDDYFHQQDFFNFQESVSWMEIEMWEEERDD